MTEASVLNAGRRTVTVTHAPPTAASDAGQASDIFENQPRRTPVVKHRQVDMMTRGFYRFTPEILMKKYSEINSSACFVLNPGPREISFKSNDVFPLFQDVFPLRVPGIDSGSTATLSRIRSTATFQTRLLCPNTHIGKLLHQLQNENSEFIINDK